MSTSEKKGIIGGTLARGDLQVYGHNSPTPLRWSRMLGACCVLGRAKYNPDAQPVRGDWRRRGNHNGREEGVKVQGVSSTQSQHFDELFLHVLMSRTVDTAHLGDKSLAGTSNT